MTTTNVPPPVSASRKLGQVYLSLLLDAQTPALISTQQSQEVLEVAASQITAMPDMPPGVLGLFNRRGHICWVVDLPQSLGLSPLDANQALLNVVVVRVSTRSEYRQEATLLDSGYVSMGFAVSQVRGSLRLVDPRIQPITEHYNSPLKPYLSGLLQHQETLYLVLDAEAIAQASLN